MDDSTLDHKVQSITQMTYIPRSILSNSIDNNNKDINFGQLFPCVIVALPVLIRFQAHIEFTS